MGCEPGALLRQPIQHGRIVERGLGGGETWRLRVGHAIEQRHDPLLHGTTGGNTVQNNGKNEVFFRNETGGGPAATFWWGDSTGKFVDADIVFYDANFLFFTGTTGCSGGSYIEDIATHEFGHMLGMDHSQVGSATMYPSTSYCSQNWRTLDPDDIAGIEKLYPSSGSTDDAPKGPGQPHCCANSTSPASSLKIAWVDYASNETGFAIERSKSGGTYAEIARVGINVVSYVNSSLSSGTTYSYRVRAYNSAGYSAYSNAASATTQTATTSPTSTPYGGVRAPLPGRVQAENFDEGGQSVGYYDTTSGNSGGAYRTTNVDVAPTTDAGGGYYVGWTKPGEWLKYSVNVTTSGTYTLNVRVASKGTGGKFHVEVDGVNVSGSMTLPDTAGWQTWRTSSKPGIALSAGSHALRLVMDTGTAQNGAWATSTGSSSCPLHCQAGFRPRISMPVVPRSPMSTRPPATAVARTGRRCGYRGYHRRWRRLLRRMDQAR